MTIFIQQKILPHSRMTVVWFLGFRNFHVLSTTLSVIEIKSSYLSGLTWDRLQPDSVANTDKQKSARALVMV